MKKEFWKCSGNAAEEYINICKMSINDEAFSINSNHLGDIDAYWSIVMKN